MVGRRRPPEPPDPWSVLGLESGSSAAAIREARRELAKRAHPDVGGSAIAMQRINAAAAAALSLVASGADPRIGDPDRHSDRHPNRHADAATGRRHERVADERSGIRVVYDHPSFTVEALPVDTFEGLLVVAAWLGEVVVDEPPYELEVALADPLRCWCRLEVVPDAGASTVSVAIAAEPGHPRPDLEVVRDAWIDGLNQLDWAALPDRPIDHRGGRPPS